MAEWLFDGHTARRLELAVNQAWQWLMGRGLVDAVDDVRDQSGFASGAFGSTQR
ncbi:MAG: DUF1553 domain-containing protein [Pirellulales bacterium]